MAHADQQPVLFERIKAVLTLLAKQGQAGSAAEGTAAVSAESKVLLDELVGQATRQHKDPSMQKAYTDCLLLLAKHYYDSPEKQVRDQLVAAFKDLLKKYLGGRVQTASLNAKFFQAAFEQCPGVALALVKVILRGFLPKGAEGESKEDGEEGSRSNHQRVMAIELYGLLIKVAQKDAAAKKLLAKNLPLLGAVVGKVVETAETWQQKKVKKTGLAVGLYAKAAKALLSGPDADLEEDPRKTIAATGTRLIKDLEAATEKDKSMSNLKGKIKEIKRLIEA